LFLETESVIIVSAITCGLRNPQVHIFLSCIFLFWFCQQENAGQENKKRTKVFNGGTAMNLPNRLHMFLFAEGSMRIGKLLIIGAVFAAAGVIIAGNAVGQAQSDTTIPRVPNPPLNSDLVSLPGDLRAVAVPTPPNLDDFVRDPAMARALGKALFWDM
jgi:hypothetical protein